MPAKISGGGRKIQSFRGGWNKWEAQDFVRPFSSKDDGAVAGSEFFDDPFVGVHCAESGFPWRMKFSHATGAAIQSTQNNQRRK